MAGITAIAAQIRVPLPFTPVPLTLQVFAVLLSGIWLGRGYGAVAQSIYLVSGLFLPCYSGFLSGTGALLGPTGGYIAGFIFAAYTAGLHFNIFVRLSASIMIIYLFGAVHFHLVTDSSAAATFNMAVAPFIGFDIAKAMLVAFIFDHKAEDTSSSSHR